MVKQDLKKALGIFEAMFRSDYGYIEYSTDTMVLFEDYQLEEVKDCLDTIASTYGFEILARNSGTKKETKRIYLVPTQDCKYAYSSADIKKYIHTQENKNFDYLMLYLLLLLINEFFGGTPISVTKNYITEQTYMHVIEQAVDRQKVLTVEDAISREFNVDKACQTWCGLTGEVNDRLTSKVGFVRKVLKFAKSHDLISIREEDEVKIFPTIKLQDLVLNSKLNLSERMKVVLAQKEEDNA